MVPEKSRFGPTFKIFKFGLKTISNFFKKEYAYYGTKAND